MNVLFLSMMCLTSLDESNIYSDLLRKFILNGHHVDIICPIEKRYNFSDVTVSGDGFNIYYQHVGNITNTGFAEKGVSILKYRKQIKDCIKEKIGKKKIDLFLVAVPPVTVNSVVSFVKKKYKCQVYLLLKDIWPASMFDLKTTGGPILKKIVCKVFRIWEKNLYKLSDSIGCLSQENVNYICKNNSYIDCKNVHINPNSIEPHDIKPLSAEERNKIRNKYGIPTDKICFVYGGTLGVGQNVSHIVECMKVCEDLNCHFLIVGKGVQSHLIDQYIKQFHPQNLTFINWLPKEEYDKLMQSCDVGMVFLRYTAQTPNIPSRILTYMDYSLPILSCTDPISDLNKILEDGEIGWGCLSNYPDSFKNKVQEVLTSDVGKYGKMSNKYLRENYSVEKSYNIIIQQMKKV